MQCCVHHDFIYQLSECFSDTVLGSTMDSTVQNMIAALHNPKQVGALDVAKHVAYALFFGARHLVSDGSRQVEILCEL